MYPGFEHTLIKYCCKYEDKFLNNNFENELFVDILRECGNSLFKKNKLLSARKVYYCGIQFGWNFCKPMKNKSNMIAILFNNIAVTYCVEKEFEKAKIWAVQALDFKPDYEKCQIRLKYILKKL
ncbi:MAG: hypothetical protein GY938_28555 [Ketobacter sp.]|nr:hypothetical protein [Ketobacter sp.]